MDNILNNGITKYFSTLASYGYLNHSTVNELLVLLFIQEILEDDYIQYLTEDDKKTINEVFNKLINSCTLFNLSDNPEILSPTHYIYCGNSAVLPDLNTILRSKKLLYNDSMSFEVLGDLECIWFAVPKGVTPNSVKNTGFLSDEFLNKFSSQEILVNRQLVLVLYTYLSPRALGNPALVTLN